MPRHDTPDKPHAEQSRRGTPAWRARMRRTLYLIAVALIILSLLPYAIGYGLTAWLRAHGAGAATVGDVDFNPATGTLVIHDLQTVKNGASLLSVDRLAVEFDWSPLWQRRALLPRVDIQGASLTVEQHGARGWRIAGLYLPSGEMPTPPSTVPTSIAWGIGIGQVHVSDSDVYYIDPTGAYHLRIDTAQLSGARSWQPRQRTRLSVRGALDGAGLRLEANGSPFAAPLSFDGSLQLDALNLAGEVGRALTGWQTAAKIHHIAGRLSIDSRLHLSVSRTGRWDATQRGIVKIAGMTLTGAIGRVEQPQMAWSGTVHVHVQGTRPQSGRSGFDLSADGRLTAQGTRWRSADGRWRVEQGDGQWQGQLNLTGGSAPRIDGALQLTGLDVAAPAAGLEVLRAGHVRADEVSVRGAEHIRIGRLSMQDVRALGEAKAALLQAGSIDASQLAFGGRRLTLQAVRFGAARFDLRRRSDGRLAFLHRLEALRGEASIAATPGGASRAEVAIGSVRLLGASRLQFEDRSITPPYRGTLHFEQARLSHLDSAAPTRGAQFVLSAKVNRYGHLDANGTLNVFTSPLALQLEAQLRALDLPPLSGYTAKRMGYDVRSGHLDAKLRLRIETGRLDGETQLLFNNLDVAAHDTARAQQLATQIGMPLDAALAVLRDGDNNVRLSVPISGDVTDPQFGFGNAFNQALGKAMRLAAVGYLKNYLQPFGSLISIVQLAGGVSLLRLDPVMFAPARDNLSPDALAYVERLAKLLRDKPSLRLRLCPMAVAADRTGATGANEAGVLVLATRRAEAIKAALVERHGIAPARLFVCQPALDADPAARPRVNVEL